MSTRSLLALPLVFVCLSGLAADDDARVDRDMCGHNSLALVLAFLSGNPDQSALDELLPTDQAPFSFADLEEAARELGFRTSLIGWNSPREATFDCPAILHVRSSRSPTVPDHFLACFGETAEGICVADFPHPPLIMPRNRLEQIWDGHVLYVDRGNGATIDRLRRELYRDRGLTVIGVTAAILLAGRIAFEGYHVWIRRKTQAVG